MKVFISSLIGNYEAYRAAAAEAVETLGHHVVRAEDFPALPGTPQRACLAAVRESDAVVLLLGANYGSPQASGLSATHEEYREAKERKPVLVFAESGVTREPAQEEFLSEVQAWSTGHFRASFRSPEELKVKVLRALHDQELATAAGPLDEAEMLARATAMLPTERAQAGWPQLFLAVAGGPHQQVLRPTGLEHADLARHLQREALFGEHPIFETTEGTTSTIRNGGGHLAGAASPDSIHVPSPRDPTRQRRIRQAAGTGHHGRTDPRRSPYGPVDSLAVPGFASASAASEPRQDRQETP